MHAGKDTLGEHLVLHQGYTRLAFADLLKEAIWTLNPLVPLDTALPTFRAYRLQDIGRDRAPDGTPIERANACKDIPEVRRLLQAMGNEVGQGLFGKDFWVEKTLAKINDGDRVVITDVRYPHEATAIQGVGGVVIRVTRPGHVVASDHPSETMVDLVPANYDVVNDGSLDALFRNAEGMLRRG